MSDLEFWPRLVLAVLATWRITHLLANEDGPADLVARLRANVGSGAVGRAMDCFHCLSFWVAAPIAVFVTWRPLDLLFTWLALSGAACLLQRVGRDPVVIEPLALSMQGDAGHGMLRERAGAGQAIGHPGDGAGPGTRPV